MQLEGHTKTLKSKVLLRELSLRKERDNILTGKWADQLGAGDFKVTVGYLTSPTVVAKSGRMCLYGNWKHSKSEVWDGIFEGVKLLMIFQERPTGMNE